MTRTLPVRLLFALAALGLVDASSCVLSIDRDAWDMFLVYGPDVRWIGANPPKPDFWMHQLPGIDSAPRLDGNELASQVLRRLPSAARRPSSARDAHER